MGVGSAERVPRPGNARLQRPRRDRRAGRHCDGDLQEILAPSAPDSLYPHGRRLSALFAASLGKPTSLSVVTDLVRDIVDGDGWELRYPAGPDAAPVLKRRASNGRTGHRGGGPERRVPGAHQAPGST